jgi:hypothetical protein
VLAVNHLPSAFEDESQAEAEALATLDTGERGGPDPESITLASHAPRCLSQRV